MSKDETSCGTIFHMPDSISFTYISFLFELNKKIISPTTVLINYLHLGINYSTFHICMHVWFDYSEIDISLSGSAKASDQNGFDDILWENRTI